MQTLALDFWGARQSYVLHSPGITRPIPTKSAVAGLVMNAFGLSHDDPAVLNRDLVAFNRNKVHVRVDCPGEIVRDFCTASGFRAADGTSRRELSDDLKWAANRTWRIKRPKRVIYQPTLIHDARFTVLIEGNDLQAIHDAVLLPKRTLYLGRKFLMPMLPNMVIGLYDATAADVAEDLPIRSAGDDRLISRRIDYFAEVNSNDGAVIMDVAESFMPHVFGPRLLTRKLVHPERPDRQAKDDMPRRRTPPEVIAAQLRRDGYLCRYCRQPGCFSGGRWVRLQFHHIVYVRYGDEIDGDGIMLCHICHRAATGLNQRYGHFDPTELSPARRDHYEAVRLSILESEKMELSSRRDQIAVLPY